jgi:hypothetical protein
MPYGAGVMRIRLFFVPARRVTATRPGSDCPGNRWSWRRDRNACLHRKEPDGTYSPFHWKSYWLYSTLNYLR